MTKIEKLNKALFAAANAGDCREIERLVASGARLDEKAPATAPYYGVDALILATCGGHSDAVDALLRHGAPTSTEAGCGTALSEAAASGHTGILKALLSAGARNFSFGLFNAINSGRLDVVKCVVEAKVPLASMRNRQGQTLLEAAIARKQDSIARLLMESGIHPEDGGPLVQSAARGDISLTSLLIQHGAVPKQTDRLKRYPLSIACSHGHRKVAELLLQNGADPTKIDVRGWSCMDWANHGGNKGFIRWLRSFARQHHLRIPERVLKASGTAKNSPSPLDTIDQATVLVKRRR